MKIYSLETGKEQDTGINGYPFDWSRDGRFILYGCRAENTVEGQRPDSVRVDPGDGILALGDDGVAPSPDRSLSRSPLVGSWKLHLGLADCGRMTAYSEEILPLSAQRGTTGRMTWQVGSPPLVHCGRFPSSSRFLALDNSGVLHPAGATVHEVPKTKYRLRLGGWVEGSRP
jgi:hypothetical protein